MPYDIYICIELYFNLREFDLQTIRHLCPCALGGVAKGSFGLGDCRLSRRSNVMFSAAYSVTPRPDRIRSVFVQD
jgi:hypothetical protein